MSESSSKLRCPSCGEAMEIRISKVTEQHATIDDVKGALEEWTDQVDVSEGDGSITVTPKGYLGKELWYQMNSALKPFGAEWVSAGKESRWIIKKK